MLWLAHAACICRVCPLILRSFCTVVLPRSILVNKSIGISQAGTLADNLLGSHACNHAIAAVSSCDDKRKLVDAH